MLRFTPSTPKSNKAADLALKFYTADFTITGDSYFFPIIPASTAAAPNSNISAAANSSPSAHQNPLGAHPSTPFRTDHSKKNAGAKVELTIGRFYALELTWLALAGALMAL